MEKIVLTHRFRIKTPSARRFLKKKARAVNFVWNYCNEVSYNSVRKYSKFLNKYDLTDLTKGCSKELSLNSQTVQAICFQYFQSRKQFKKIKLRWRTKDSLSWLPTTNQNIKFTEKGFIYDKKEFKVFNFKKLEGKFLCGSFSEDSKGNWYLNLTCEEAVLPHRHSVDAVGIDLGLKTTAVLSDGYAVKNNQEFRKLEQKLAKAQRHKHKKQVKNIHTKIKNKRKDFLHKESLNISKTYKNIFVGNVSGKFLQKTNGKSSADASISVFKNLLKYKAVKHSGQVFEINESFSTLTCSACAKRTGPQGLTGLSIREWKCGNCSVVNDRDVNAAKNILRFGQETLILKQAQLAEGKGSPAL
jgi:transposase